MKEFIELVRSKGLLFKELYPLDLRIFGIKKRIQLFEGVDLQNRYMLLAFIKRKSRFLRKDAHDLLEIMKRIEMAKSYNFAKKILFIQGPLCSKAKKILEEEGLRVFTL